MNVATLRLTIDSTGAIRGSAQWSQATAQVNRSAQQTGGVLSQLTSALNENNRVLKELSGARQRVAAMQDMRREQQRLARETRDAARQQAQALDGVTSSVRRLVAAFIAYTGVRETFAATDLYKNLEARVRLVTASEQQRLAVQRQLLQASRESYTSLQSTTDLYARVARASEALGASQADVLRFTKATQQAFIISGATASEANNSVIQLGQAIASSVLRGDELRSVLENAPRLAAAIAKEFGVTTGELRNLGEEGKLLGERVFKAILDDSRNINKEMETIPLTLNRAAQVAKNELLVALGEFDRRSGFTKTLAEGIVSIADNARTFFTVMATGITALVVSQVPALIGALGRARIALIAFGAANPFTALLTGVSVFVGYMLTRHAQAMDDAKRRLDDYRNTVRQMDAETRQLQLASLGKLQASLYGRLQAERQRVASSPVEQRLPGGDPTLAVNRQVQAERAHQAELEKLEQQYSSVTEKIQALGQVMSDEYLLLRNIKGELATNTTTTNTNTEATKEAEKARKRLLATTKALLDQFERELKLRDALGTRVQLIDPRNEQALAQRQLRTFFDDRLYDDQGSFKLGGRFGLTKSFGAVADAGRATTDEVDRFAKRLSRVLQDTFAQTFQRIVDGGLRTFGDFANALGDLFKTALVQGLASEVTRAVAGAMDTLIAGARSGIGGVSHLLAPGSKKILGVNSAQAVGAAAGGLAGFGIGYGAANTGIGLVGGAAAGFALGGPAGAIVGGVAGIVGGLFGQSKRAAEARRAWEEENRKFGLALDDLVDNLRGLNKGVEGELRAVRRQVDEAVDRSLGLFRGSDYGKILKYTEGVDLGVLRQTYEQGGAKAIEELLITPFQEAGRRIPDEIQELVDRLYELEDAAKDAAAEVQRLADLESARRSEDLQTRLDTARLDGSTDPAALRALEDRQVLLAQQRELEDALQAEWTESQIALLELIHREERLALERRRAAEDAAELERQAKAQREAERTAQDFDLDVLRRRAVLSGDAEQMYYAEMAALQRKQEREMEAAQELLAANTITEASFNDFLRLLEEEWADALDRTAQEVARAAAIMKQNAQDLRQEFEVFGTSLAEQVQQVGDLYGFSGKSKDELLDLYTRVTPGQELTDEQRRLNDQIAEYLRLVTQRDAALAAAADEAVSQDTATGTGRAPTPSGTVYTGPVTVQINLNVRPDDLQDADRTAQQIVDRVDRLLGGRATLQRNAAGRT